MKKLGVGRIAWIFAGSVLGAGFVSGQELWQFFGRFGTYGIIGLIAAMIIFMLLGTVILRNANMAASVEVDKVVLPFKSRLASAAVGTLQIIFLFGIVTIMTAGAGELVNHVTGAPKWIVCLFMSLLTVIIAAAGLDGVVYVFSFCVPLIAVASVFFAVASLFCFDNPIKSDSIGGSAFVSNWLAAAVTYASYNIFAAMGVLCPFGKIISDKKMIFKGTALGTLILLLISGSILAALSQYPEAVDDGMPMLALAEAVSPVLSYVYGIFLFCGLLQTSISCLVAVNTYMSAKFEFASRHRLAVVCIIGAASFALSLFGFGELIGTVYPIFGYIATVLIVCMLTNFFRLKRML